jgi:hypothetical protein
VVFAAPRRWRFANEQEGEGSGGSGGAGAGKGRREGARSGEKGDRTGAVGSAAGCGPHAPGGQESRGQSTGRRSASHRTSPLRGEKGGRGRQLPCAKARPADRRPSPRGRQARERYGGGRDRPRSVQGGRSWKAERCKDDVAESFQPNICETFDVQAGRRRGRHGEACFGQDLSPPVRLRHGLDRRIVDLGLARSFVFRRRRVVQDRLRSFPGFRVGSRQWFPVRARSREDPGHQDERYPRDEKGGHRLSRRGARHQEERKRKEPRTCEQLSARIHLHDLYRKERMG